MSPRAQQIYRIGLIVAYAPISLVCIIILAEFVASGYSFGWWVDETTYGLLGAAILSGLLHFVWRWIFVSYF
jgi:hypothetical protein